MLHLSPNQPKGNWICFSGDHPRDSIFPQWYVNQVNAEIIEIIAQLNSQGSANQNSLDIQTFIDLLNRKSQ